MMGKYVLIKKDGQTTKMDITPDFEAKIKEKRGHKCWENCENATVLCCQKIADDVKSPIDKYDFITDGYQIFDEDGKMLCLHIDECENYKKAKPVKLSAEEQRRIKLIREDLRKAFFGTDDLKEAYTTQFAQMRDGRISGVRGKTLADFLINAVRDALIERKEKNIFNLIDEELENVRLSVNKSLAYYTGEKEYFKSGNLLKANIIMLAVNSVLNDLNFKKIEDITLDKVDSFIRKVNNYLDAYTDRHEMFNSLDTIEMVYNKSKEIVDEETYGTSIKK